MNLYSVEPAEIIASLLKDKISLKRMIEERNLRIKSLEEKLSKYERMNINYGK